MRIYAIGDIHGHLDKLTHAHDLIAADGGGPVIHVGDLVDRGPDSRGVVDYLLQGQAVGRDWHVLKGNHDRMMCLWLEPVPRRDPVLRAEFDWLSGPLGGVQTLASYGVDGTAPDAHAKARAAVPQAHIDWLAALPTWWQNDDLCVVHAGIRPGVPLESQDEDDLLWIRQQFHDDPRDHGPLIVHGHTPVDRATHYGNRVNLDSGAGYGRALTVAVFEGRQAWQLTDTGRAPLLPE